MKICVLQPIGTQCTFFMHDLALWHVIWARQTQTSDPMFVQLYEIYNVLLGFRI